MLPFIPPMIVRMGKEAFDDDRYIFEPKWDGWRLLIYKSRNKIEAYTRNGRLVTHQFPELQEALGAIEANEAILDAEGICIRNGRPVFDDFAFRGRLSKQNRIEQARWTHPATFVVFDVLYAGGFLYDEPLMSRKKHLEDILRPTPVITPTLFVEGEGTSLFRLMKQQKMEGIVAKRKTGMYTPGKVSTDWLKIKHWNTIDTVILGYRTHPRFALIVGLQFRTIRNKKVSTVELGFKPQDKEWFLEVAPVLHQGKAGAVQWVEPKLCCRIDYLERTDMHQLRTSIFRGFLPEKKPEECVWPYE
ncbi:RNA ligase family protein [Paenibacillus rigui]|uniref:DNA ligase n=1 Tax=Paenibacillus rigui TaxID=554312 RepID=A0A229UTC8_9BACL|nr:RNA ligase family protein [Paenibacillus rigui]OXM86149.1 DNA ligase [Paenibacillus rigui]